MRNKLGGARHRFLRSPIMVGRFRSRLERSTPLLVLQMGKVGSASVYHSLVRQTDRPVLHAHTMDPNREDSLVREVIRHHAEGGRLQIISLTREPISRNISAFFQNYERFVGHPLPSEITATELRSEFLERFFHAEPLVWFDDVIEGSVGVDVYAKPFPTNGAQRHVHDNVELLVLQQEAGAEPKEQAIREFLQLQKFRLTSSNVSRSKSYGDIYARFRKHLVLPESYVQGMCSSKYATHFYEADWLSRVQRYWTTDARTDDPYRRPAKLGPHQPDVAGR